MLILARHANQVSDKALQSIGEGPVRVLFPEQVRQSLKKSRFFRKFRTEDRVYLYTPAPFLVPESFSATAAALFLGRRAFHLDAEGNTRPILWGEVTRTLGTKLREHFLLGRYLNMLDRELRHLEASTVSRCKPKLRLSGVVAYLRPDLIAGLKAGGSVAHISGVINSLPSFNYTPIFYAVENMPLVQAEFKVIRPENQFLWSHRGLPALTFSPQFARQVKEDMGKRSRVAFLYQRHGLNTWAGAQLALETGLPFVLEYNGSEVWVARNWGTPIAREELGTRVEKLSLDAADLIVVVSRVLKDELVARGLEPGKILVNANGVDVSLYSPEVDKATVRSRLEFEGKVVVGFVGTFGRWHGAEKLAEAWGLLGQKRPDLKEQTALLFVGDGLTLPDTKAELRKWGAEAVFTGTVPQEDGPNYLAACDILVAPHVPNADGSPFFGSPTKLFEYMAMGKAIVSSDLEQLGQVIEHEQTGLLTVPGDASSLAFALERLIGDPVLRETLGANARVQAVEKHTWQEHTARIINALKERCSVEP